MSQTVNPVPSASSFVSRVIEKNGEGYTVSEKWIVPAAQETAFLTSNTINSTHSIYTGSRLVNIRSEPNGGEGDQLFDYALTYEKYSTATRGKSGPPILAATPKSSDPVNDLYELDGLSEDVAIEDHPSYDVAWETSKPLVETYMVPGMVWKKTVFVDLNWSPTEADCVQDVLTIQAPDGLTGATANKWLRLPNVIRLQGAHYEFVKSWRYTPTPDGWDGDVYGS